MQARYVYHCQGCKRVTYRMKPKAACPFCDQEATFVHEVNQSQRWPFWARCIGLFKHAADVGVGDTIKRLLGPIGSVWEKKTKCKCKARRNQLNARYAYPRETCNG